MTTMTEFLGTSGFPLKERSALMSTIPMFPLSLESSFSIAMLLAAREDQSCILPVTAGPSTAVHKVQYLQNHNIHT